MKCDCMLNLELSFKEAVWATSFGPTAKLREAYNSC
jgi:hypothetical protein